MHHFSPLSFNFDKENQIIRKFVTLLIKSCEKFWVGKNQHTTQGMTFVRNCQSTVSCRTLVCPFCSRGSSKHDDTTYNFYPKLVPRVSRWQLSTLSVSLSVNVKKIGKQIKIVNLCVGFVDKLLYYEKKNREN